MSEPIHMIIDAETKRTVLKPLDAALLAELQGQGPDPAVILDRARFEMSKLFKSLSVEARAHFMGTHIAVSEAMNKGDIEVARHIVQAKEVPEELETIKAQILALFP